MAIYFEHDPLAWASDDADGIDDSTKTRAVDARWLDRAKWRCLAAIFKRESLSSSLVLDVGSDNGFFVDWFLGRGAKVEGMDLSIATVDRLRSRYPMARFSQRSVCGATFPPLGVFHIVNAWTELQRVDAAAFERGLRNLSTCCDEGSRLIVCDRLGASTDHTGTDGRHYRTLATYDRVLSALGFESVATLPLYARLNRPRAGWESWHARASAVFYLMDRFARELPADNLSVGIWRYRGADIGALEPASMWPLAG